ncbi:MAG: DUF2179 domain-containing protein [Clostridiales bacterium]|nr:DUF2179 domain-containing protein [Clostridiales bacterium]
MFIFAGVMAGSTENEKDVVLCFCSAQEAPRLRAIVAQVDPSAILATLSAGEVSGRGPRVPDPGQRQQDRPVEPADFSHPPRTFFQKRSV